ncbi:sulfite exporter TauE/SafE family protein [Cognatishimia sp. SS12]|uniref:sulfite exporter TauE/SafE family protein n=1 Tax=Cognatishimia sp. SS12 TaxID=2979465 RepID=UPI0023311BF3|nr:sulfite exporter TauE/SafE family protein [Cognatishimia sp. SS12]MDC0739052.1 sulfite exporter TauE/SafE family protein [Cognatishimia sp. SS12]
MDLEFFLVAPLAVLFAGVSKGGFGGSVAFVASAILALVIPPAQAVGLMLPLLMLMDLATLRPFWGQWDMAQARILILGGLPGIAMGLALFSVISDDMLRVLLGVIAIGFVLWRNWPWATTRQTAFPKSVGYVAGFVAGLTSFISHAGGPPAAMYLLPQGMGKTRYHATVTLVFWVINALKFVPYAFLGIFTYELFIADLMLAPVALIGVWIGVRVHDVIPEAVFFPFIYFCLAATGVKLIFDALT